MKLPLRQSGWLVLFGVNVWLRPDDSQSWPCPTIYFRSCFFVHLYSYVLILHPPFFTGLLFPHLPLCCFLFSALFFLLLLLFYHFCAFLQWLCSSSLSCPPHELSSVPLSFSFLSLLLSFYLHVFLSTLVLSLLASAVITTYSFNPLPLWSGEVEVMGDFCLKLSAQLHNSWEQTIFVFSAFSFQLSHRPLHDQACMTPEVADESQ